MKQIAVGILAHVDSGKTTLSEAMLYKSGTIRSHGRVDHGNAFLDTNEIEPTYQVIEMEKIIILLVDSDCLLFLL